MCQKKLITVDTSSNIYEQAGIIHNLALYRENELFRMMSPNPEAENIGFRICNLAAEQEKSQILPAGSADIIIGGTNACLAVTDFYTGINVWGDLFNKYRADPNYMNTPLVGMLSIAYYSSQYWAYAIQTSTGGVTHHTQPEPTPQIFLMKKWLKALLGDLVGALSGASDGAAMGSIVPGLGTGVGAVIGACIEGTCGSILAANS